MYLHICMCVYEHTHMYVFIYFVCVYVYKYVCALYVCNALGLQILWPGVTVIRYYVDAGN